MIPVIRFLLSVLFSLLVLSGCAGQVEAPVDRSGEDCAAFAVCREQAGSIYTCIDGDCACAGPTQPGENRPVSCFTGEADVQVDPWHPRATSERAQ